MFRLKDSIHINAPIDRCFLLSTSIDLVRRTIELTPVSGKTSGLIEMGDRIIWRGWKFGLPALHETLITGFDRPSFFQDTMGRGRFRHFQHDHHFQEVDGHTVLWDVVRFSMPLGFLGRAVGRFIVVPHVLRLMTRRFELIRQLAEGDGWKQYVPEMAVSAAIPLPQAVPSTASSTR